MSFKKLLVIIATFAMLFNSVGSVALALAQEVTPTPTAAPIESTPTSTPVDTTSPTPLTIETPTPTPDILVTPTPSDTSTPAATIDPSAIDTPTPVATATATPTDTPTSQPVENNSNQASDTVPEPQVTATPTSTPAATATPNAPEIHKSLTASIITQNIFPSTVQDNNWIKLITDKLDYSPTDLVLISGTGFTPNKEYSLEIVSTDPPPVDFTNQINADSSGNISYGYQLDGNYRPNYTVYAKDGGEVMATTTFTDTSTPPSKVTICHATGSNSNPYVSANADETADAGGHDGHSGPIWFSGITVAWGDIIPPFNYSGGHYNGKNWPQGQNILNNNCNLPNTAKITIIKNTVGGDGTFNFSTTGGHGLPSSFSITTAGNSGTTTYANLTSGNSGDYTITESSINGFSLTGLSCSASYHSTQLSTSLSNRTATINNLQSGDEAICTFTNAQLLGSISGHKYNDVNGDGNWDSSHPSHEPALSNWQIFIDSNGNQTLDSGESVDTTDSNGNYSFSNLLPGTYSICEVQQVGWTNTDPGSLCQSVTIPGSGDDEDNNNYNITNVNFGNHQNPQGRITFQKIVDDGSSVSNWGFTINGIKGTYHSGDTVTLNTGTYTVTESGSTSYTPFSVSGACSNLSGSSATLSVTADGGTCTFTNHVKRGNLVVTKFLDDNADGIQSGVNEVGLSGWQMNLFGTNYSKSQITADGTNETTLGQTTFTNLLPGSYTLSETTQEGWNLSNIYCDNEDTSTDTSNEHSVLIPYGSTINCYVGNYQPAHLVVTKVVVDPNGQTLSGEDNTPFEFNVTGQKWFNLSNGQSQSFDIAPGNYDVTENTDNGYGFNGCEAVYSNESIGRQIDNGVTVELGSGDTATVTCTNQQPAKPNLSISKSTTTPNISAGGTAIYTLTVQNTGNVDLSNITITDVLPAGFAYVTGSTSGSTSSDPTISASTLSWNSISIAKGASWSVSYKTQAAGNLSNGDYTNFASCSTVFRDQNLSCDPDPVSTTVQIGNGLGYGGSIQGQVLGISTSAELPETGSPTWLPIFALGILGIGLFINGLAKKSAKRAVKSIKRVKVAKKKGKKHAKK